MFRKGIELGGGEVFGALFSKKGPFWSIMDARPRGNTRLK